MLRDLILRINAKLGFGSFYAIENLLAVIKFSQELYVLKECMKMWMLIEKFADLFLVATR